MKKISLILVMLFISIGAFAQKDMKKMKTNEEKSAMYAEKLSSELGLNANQKARIKDAKIKMLEDKKELMAEHKEEAMEGHHKMAEESAEMREAKMKIQADFKEDMKDILDANQYIKWEAMQDKGMHKSMDKNKKMMSKKMDKMDHDDDDDGTL
ncbi:hypothetical protein [Gramella sp. AN32]|uniref:Uncharacterized protein n=1 Tax=Christiangramia antarctica TaxID=2058158 RepID=A0ABW5X1U7_9FLAO|nr:hypothetical protein [Gramella sp. AN32]